MGRFKDAKIEIDKAVELDPTSPIIRTNIVAQYYLAKQYQRAIDESKKVIELAPNFGLIYGFQSIAYYKNGMEKEAIDSWVKATELTGGKTELEFKNLRNAQEKAGWKGFWTEWLYQMKANPKYYLAWDFSVCYLYIGDNEKALEWLEKSYQNRDRWIVNLRHNPQFDPVRNDPKFQDIISRIELE